MQPLREKVSIRKKGRKASEWLGENSEKETGKYHPKDGKGDRRRLTKKNKGRRRPTNRDKKELSPEGALSWKSQKKSQSRVHRGGRKREGGSSISQGQKKMPCEDMLHLHIPIEGRNGPRRDRIKKKKLREQKSACSALQGKKKKENRKRTVHHIRRLLK